VPDNAARGSALALALAHEVLTRADYRGLHLELFTIERQLLAFSLTVREQAQVAAREIVDGIVGDNKVDEIAGRGWKITATR
jgi:hypothetical protein